jgi:hypothetical protein
MPDKMMEENMTAPDPFADGPDDDEATRYGVAPNPTDTPVESVSVKKTASKKLAAVKKEEGQVADNNNEGITLTFKGGSGFDAPWVVVHAKDVHDAYETASDPLLEELFKKVQEQGTAFSGLAPEKPAAAQPQRPGAPTPPPGSPGPDWTYKEGIGKNGKPWKAWMPPRDSGLSPVWL